MENPQVQDLGPFFENEHGDKYLYSVNRDSFSKLSASEIYKDFFGVDFFKEDSLYLVVGTDSGLLVNYLVSIGLPEGSRFLFVEPQAVYDRLHEVLDLKALPPEIFIATEETFGDALKQYHGADYVAADKAFAQRTLCSLDAHLPEYVELHADMRAAMDEAKWMTINSLGNHGFVQRQLENLAGNQFSADCLKGLFKGRTAVILGVGPSLDEIIPWVQQNQDELVIIAVSRAARRLLDAEITPHLLVSIDPSIHSFDVSREMLAFVEESIFVHSHHVSSPMLGQWTGRNLYVGRRLPWDSQYNEETITLPGPTVTQLAFMLAIEMGFAQIVFGGVDLCFSREGNIYSSTTQGRELGVRLGDVRGGVETNGGWRAETIRAFLHGARVTGDMAAEANRRGCRVINMAIGAIKMANIDYLPIEKIEVQSFAVPAKDVLWQALPENNPETQQEYFQAMFKELELAEKAYKEIESLAKKALQANVVLFKQPGGKNKQKMDRVEKELNTTYAFFSSFAKRYGVLNFLKINRPGREGWKDQEEVITTGRIYYEAYRDIANEIRGLIKRGKECLQLRLMEREAQPDVVLLTELWGKYNLFSRAEKFSESRPALLSDLTSEQRSALDTLVSKHHKILSREEDMGANAVAQKDYSRLKAQALTLFQRRERDSLTVVASGLADDHAPKGEALSQLVHGYLAELDGNDESALELYEGVIAEQAEFVLEEALIRVAALSFEHDDQENLLLAIECLAALSPLYVTKYADLLWVSGDIDQALDTYADYLGRCPNDLLAMLKLGRYYFELGSKEGAHMAFNYVLERDPENSTAQKMLKEIEQLEESD